MRLRRWERELVNELLDWDPNMFGPEYGPDIHNQVNNRVNNALAELMHGGLTFKEYHQDQINKNTDAIKNLTAKVEMLLKKVELLKQVEQNNNDLKSAEERIK